MALCNERKCNFNLHFVVDNFVLSFESKEDVPD